MMTTSTNIIFFKIFYSYYVYKNLKKFKKNDEKIDPLKVDRKFLPIKCLTLFYDIRVLYTSR